MARIPDAELAGMERYLRPSSIRDMEMRRLILALREAYQEIAGLAARTAFPASPGTPAVTTTNARQPYSYQPRICPHCHGPIVVGIPHDCMGTTGGMP